MQKVYGSYSRNLCMIWHSTSFSEWSSGGVAIALSSFSRSFWATVGSYAPRSPPFFPSPPPPRPPGPDLSPCFHSARTSAFSKLSSESSFSSCKPARYKNKNCLIFRYYMSTGKRIWKSFKSDFSGTKVTMVKGTIFRMRSRMYKSFWTTLLPAWNRGAVIMPFWKPSVLCTCSVVCTRTNQSSPLPSPPTISLSHSLSLSPYSRALSLCTQVCSW